MRNLNEGYDYFQQNASSFGGSVINEKTSVSYLGNIESEIKTLESEINSRWGNANPQLKGYVAEDWARGTFNIDAASKRTGERVWTPPANDYASTDLQGSWGNSYQAKYYGDAKQSALAQAKTYKQSYNEYLGHCRHKGLPEPTIQEYLSKRGIDPNIDVNLPIYQAQARLIPADQLKDAIDALKWKIQSEPRPEQVARYQDTLNKLTDRLRSPKGAESTPLTEEESKTLAELSKNGKFDPARYDITLAKKADYLYLCQNTIFSGLSGAIVSSVLKAAPDIAKALINLIRDGKIDREDLEKIGTEAYTGAKRGFISGLTVAAIRNACALGYLGDSLQKAALDATNPAFNNVVVVLTTIIIETISDTIRLSGGKMPKQEFVQRLEKRIFISGCAITTGTVVQGLLPAAPVVGYLIGSFVGTIVGGAIFEVKEQFFMSLCIERGYTFFGLVEQDYALPDEVVKRLGLETFEFESFPFETFPFETFPFESIELEKFEFESIDIVMLKRGLIGVRKIGYVSK